MDWGVGAVLDASDQLYLALNGLSGRSPLFDALVALAVDNNLVKAGPVAAAFFLAWHRGPETARLRARRILAVTLVSLLLVLAATKTIADGVFLPRPFIHSQQAYHLDGADLVETPRLAYSPPQSGFSRGRYERLRSGDIEENDLASFPSDHAAFFFALALGIFVASRRAGLLALGWTLIVICGARMITGTHSPLDIAAGLLVGGAVLLGVRGALRGRAGRPFEAIAGWTLRHPGISSAGLFLILFEAANTLENTREILRLAKAVAQGAIAL